MLNDYTPETARNIHLLTTSLCDRDCPYCCNKQYDLSTIPQVSNEELRNAENIFLTGGEPFTYSRPNEIAKWLKKKYPNIKKVIVYSNLFEAWDYLMFGEPADYIDGLTLSIRERENICYFEDMHFLLKNMPNCKSNRLYCFGDIDVEGLIEEFDLTNFVVLWREWQPEFVPAPDSIFRRI